MKKILFCIAIGAVTLASAAAAASQTARHTATPTAQVRATIRAELRAEVAADTAAAARFIAPDFQLINVTGTPGSRSDYLTTIGGAVDFVKISPVSPIDVRLYGNVAVARYQAAFIVVAGPDRVVHRAWTTDILERRRGGWLLLRSQTTAVPNDLALFIRSLEPRA